MAFIKWRRVGFDVGWSAMFSSDTSVVGSSGEQTTPNQTNILLDEIKVITTVAIAPTPPGAGNAVSYRLKYDNNASLTPPIAISGLNTTASFTPVNAVIPASQTNYMTNWITGSPSPSGFMHVITAFEGTQNKFISYYAIGDTDSPQVSQPISLSYSNTAFLDMAGFPSYIETQAQTPWPVAGKFKNFFVRWSKFASGSTASLVLRKNGADTALAFNLTGIGGITPQGTIDSTTQIPVSIGDLCSWKIVRTSGTGTSLVIFISYGFSTV
jgi:hypothetical protein